MKKHIVLLTLLVFGYSVAGQETPPPSRSVFKISPQHFTQLQLKVGFERFNKTYSHSFSFYVNALLNSQDIPEDMTVWVESFNTANTSCLFRNEPVKKEIYFIAVSMFQVIYREVIIQEINPEFTSSMILSPTPMCALPTITLITSETGEAGLRLAYNKHYGARFSSMHM